MIKIILSGALIITCCAGCKTQFKTAPETSGDFVNVTGVACSADGKFYIAGGKSQPIFVFDESGKLLDKWGRKHIKVKHGLRLNGNNVWVTDIENHQLLKFSKDGKLLMALGEKGVPANDKTHFNKPTDLAFAPNGNIYVSDGYGNSRIVCLSPEGKFLFAWGSGGKDKGQFKYPHNIVIDKKGVVYVADRGNNRIQVFSPEGKFLAVWQGFGKPYGLSLDKDGNIWATVTDGSKWHGLILFNKQGDILKRTGGKPGKTPGKFAIPHSVSVNQSGQLLVGEVKNQRIQVIGLNHK